MYYSCRYELEDVPLLVLEAATCVTSLSLDTNNLAALPPAMAAFTCLVELLSVCDNRLQALPHAPSSHVPALLPLQLGERIVWFAARDRVRSRPLVRVCSRA